MLQGIYLVTFQSSLATVGEGLVVFDACGVHGANETHMFRGMQEEADGKLRLHVEIRHLQGEKYPSFGELAAVNLELVVENPGPEYFRVTGFVREAKNIRLNGFCKKLGDLVGGPPA